MRNMRGAWRALLFAGAAYAWKNRAKLSQQFKSLRNQYDSQPRRPSQSRQYELPDLSTTEQRDFNTRPYAGTNEREIGGTSM